MTPLTNRVFPLRLALPRFHPISSSLPFELTLLKKKINWNHTQGFRCCFIAGSRFSCRYGPVVGIRSPNAAWFEDFPSLFTTVSLLKDFFFVENFLKSPTLLSP